MFDFTITTQNYQGTFNYNEDTNELILEKRDPIVLFFNGPKVLSLGKVIPFYKYPFAGKVIGTIEEDELDPYYWVKIIATKYLMQMEELPYAEKGISMVINVIHSSINPRVKITRTNTNSGKVIFNKEIKASELENAYLLWAEESIYNMHDKTYRAVVVHDQKEDYDETVYTDEDGVSVEMSSPYKYGDKKFREEIIGKIISKTSDFEMLIWRYFNEPDEFAAYFIYKTFVDGNRKYGAPCLNAHSSEYDEKVQDAFDDYHDAVEAVEEFFYGKEKEKK